ncbi:conserved oligomeric Golgi complex component-related / COG complex component-related [Euphorbia peplus]|nr:conserved oligomeric Golgi complex component-related / COG complex component-related [Euphorbia peplus]
MTHRNDLLSPPINRRRRRINIPVHLHHRALRSSLHLLSFWLTNATVAVRSTFNDSSRKADFMSNEEEWSIVQGALQILTIVDCLTSRSSVFEASLRSTLARLSTSLSLSIFGLSLDQNKSHAASNDVNGESSLGGRAALDVAAVRLVDVPEKARRLFNLLDQLYEFIFLFLFSFPPFLGKLMFCHLQSTFPVVILLFSNWNLQVNDACLCLFAHFHLLHKLIYLSK